MARGSVDALSISPHIDQYDHVGTGFDTCLTRGETPDLLE